MDLEHRQQQVGRELLRHEVRTGLIRQLTGLTDHGIRGLYRSEAGEVPVRHRGKSPVQVTFLWKNEPLREDAAVFVCLWRRESEVLRLEPAEQGLAGRLRVAEGFCDTYGLFRQFCPQSPLTLERAYSVVRALKNQQGIRAEPCERCGALWLVDALAMKGERCGHCKASERQALDDEPARTRGRKSRSQLLEGSPQQQCLFGGEAEGESSRL